MGNRPLKLARDLGWPTWTLAFFGAGLFAFRAIARFSGAGHDDTFITLLAAETLAGGEGFISSDGQPGEISSSLLHVVCLALLSRLGVDDLYLANKVMGLALGIFTLVLVVYGSRVLFPERTTAVQLAAASLAGLSFLSLPTALYWTLGGLETPLVAFLVTWLALELSWCTSRSVYRLAFVGTLLVLVRPEGWVYACAIALVGSFLRLPSAWFLKAVGIPALAFVLLSLSRLLFFGVWLPLPALAKLSSEGPFTRILEGFSYLWAFAEASTLGFVLLTGFGLFGLALLLSILRSGRGFLASTLLPRLAVFAVIGAHLVTVVLSGGDWMGFYRFVAPVVPLLGVAFAQGVSAAHPAISPPVLATLLVTLGLTALPLGEHERSGLRFPHMRNTSLQASAWDLLDPRLGSTLGERVRSLNHPYLRDVSQLEPFVEGPLEELLRLKPHLLIATYQMGYLPHRVHERGLRNVGFLDTVGITDRVLAGSTGSRSARGLNSGLDPTLFLDPDSEDPIARAVQSRRPDLIYLLRAENHTVARLENWGWLLFWNAPEAKIFVRRELLLEFFEAKRAFTGRVRAKPH